MKAALLLLALILANFLAQVAMKPSELYRFTGIGQAKTARETWDKYQPQFQLHGTKVMTPDFLAALAQTESSGNPYAQPSWVWRLRAYPWRMFGPASSAVGLMQMTDGNFEQARRFCIRNHRPAAEGCGLNAFYSRLSPSDSIEMTSAFLHRQVERLTPPKTPLRRRQELAAVIHLCGPEKGPEFIRARFDPAPLGVCGRQAVGPYVRRVRLYQEQFLRMASKTGKIEPR